MFAGRLRKTADNLGNAPRVAAAAGALLVKNTILEHDRAIVPTLVLTGVGRKGAKIGVRYIPGINAMGRAATLVVATGPAHLIERTTTAHEIVSKSLKATGFGRARQRTAKALGNKAKGFGPVARVYVRGVYGRHPFERGVEEARPLVGAAWRSAVHQQLAKELL